MEKLIYYSQQVQNIYTQTYFNSTFDAMNGHEILSVL